MYISDLGIKVYLKKIKFGELRDETMEFHLAFEAKMLNNYAKILIEMLTGEQEDRITTIDDLLEHQVKADPELKSILYECLHAQDKIQERDQAAYENEINEFILQDKMKKRQIQLAEENDKHRVIEF